MTRRLELTEWQTETGVDLTAVESRALSDSGVVTVTPSRTVADAWDVRPGSTVGVVRVGDLEVWIRPKVPVDRLMFLLLFAQDERGWDDMVADFSPEDDLVAAIAMAYAHHLDAALRQGVLQGYRTIDEAELTLRGRLRAGDQLARRHALPLPLEVTYDDFTVDIVENQMLRTAAVALLRLPLVPVPALRRLQRGIHRLDGATVLPPGLAPRLPRITRLNRRYAGALRLADLILRARSLAFEEGRRAGTGFLFDMNRVFEDFVTRTLRDALEAKSGIVTGQHRSHLDEDGRIVIKPDITWWQGHDCLAVMDAKYKSLATKDLPNADVYQVLAYATRFRLPVGHLIYAAGNEDPAIHAIQNAGVDVHVHALDLSLPPSELLEAVERLADRIADHALVFASG